MEEKAENFKKIIEQLASDCREENIDGLCILSRKGENDKSLTAMICGNLTEIALATVMAMKNEPRMKALLESAVECNNAFSTSPISDDLSEFLNKFCRN